MLEQVVDWSSVYIRLRVILAVNYAYHQNTGKMKLKLAKTPLVLWNI